MSLIGNDDLAEELPSPGELVADEIVEIVEQIRKLTNSIADAMVMGEKPYFLGLCIESEQLLRRLDFDAADRMKGLIADTPLIDGVDEYRVQMATGLLRGVCKASLIEGPATGATSPNLTIYNQAHASATASSSVSLSIERIEVLVEGLDLEHDVLEGLDSLKTAAVAEDRIGVLNRVSGVMEKLKPFPDLAAAVLKLADQIVN